MNTYLGLERSRTNGGRRLRCIAADKLSGAVHNHLRCIGTIQSQAPHIVRLARAEGRRRIRIGPSNMVPIVYMFAEHDDVSPGDCLFAIKLLQQGIGRWTTGASFGSE